MTVIDRLLSNTQRKRIDNTNERISTLYFLSDADLGQELLTLADQAWGEMAAHYADDTQSLDRHRSSYFGGLVFQLIPELAARLTYSADAMPVGINITPDEKFRELAGNIILNQSNSPVAHKGQELPTAYELLTREVVNGNALAIALDRIVKPSKNPQMADELSKQVRSISVLRGLTERDCWTPAMQDYRELAATRRDFLGARSPDGAIETCNTESDAQMRATL